MESEQAPLPHRDILLRPSFLSSHRSGPARKVPGRHGMSYTEEDWVDDEATSRRGSDE